MKETGEYRNGEPVLLHGNGKKETHSEFVNKFKPKHTTDDCMTPPEVYDCVADWVAKTYDLDRACFVRPFWPGGDYEEFDYPEGCVVVDNPPFSQLAKIYKFYNEKHIKFFVFCSALTQFSSSSSSSSFASSLVCGVSIEYDNGAKVPTSFTTNLEDCRARTVPDLYQKLQEVVDDLRATKVRKLPKYEYPSHVAYPARMMQYAKYGINYGFDKNDSYHIGKLDAMNKRIFGLGYLLSDKAAQAQAQAQAQAVADQKIFCELSDREREIIAKLGK